MKSLEERIITLGQEQTGWVEPLRRWLIEAQTGLKIAQDNDLNEKKVIAKKMFGSNLLLFSQNLTLQTPIFERGKIETKYKKTPTSGVKNQCKFFYRAFIRIG
ncbi:MAG: hypothetical protein EXS55_03695 [Candidatus Magasanikbacteria bacterium]|nr:hypothetical protein [Candidatus Magasanikbacteria bacterium]